MYLPFGCSLTWRTTTSEVHCLSARRRRRAWKICVTQTSQIATKTMTTTTRTLPPSSGERQPSPRRLPWRRRPQPDHRRQTTKTVGTPAVHSVTRPVSAEQKGQRMKLSCPLSVRPLICLNIGQFLQAISPRFWGQEGEDKGFFCGRDGG